MESFAVPLGALIVSLASLVFTAISLRDKADDKHVTSVEERLKVAEAALQQCEAGRETDRLERVQFREEVAFWQKKVMQIESKMNGGTG